MAPTRQLLALHYRRRCRLAGVGRCGWDRNQERVTAGMSAAVFYAVDLANGAVTRVAESPATLRSTLAHPSARTSTCHEPPRFRLVVCFFVAAALTTLAHAANG